MQFRSVDVVAYAKMVSLIFRSNRDICRIPRTIKNPSVKCSVGSWFFVKYIPSLSPR